MTEEQISTEALRLRLADLATQAQGTGAAYGVQAIRGRPRYQLAPVDLVEDEQVRACVRIGPDEFRRSFSEIRALVRIDDVPFGILLRGKLTAIFRRHPEYRPVAAERYREEYRSRRDEAPTDLATRLRALESQVATLVTKSADHAVPGGTLAEQERR